MRFGQDRGCGDACVGGVAVHHSLRLIAFQRPPLVSVDKQEFRLYAQFEHGALHARNGCPQDVEAVDLFGVDGLDRPSYGLLLDDAAQFFAGGFAHLLGVVQERMVEAFGQDDRRREHGTSKRPPSGLVAAGFDDSWIQVWSEMYLPWHRSHKVTYF